MSVPPMHLWPSVPVRFYSHRGGHPRDIAMRECPHGRFHFDPAYDSNSWLIGPSSCENQGCVDAVKHACAEMREHKQAEKDRRSAERDAQRVTMDAVL